MKNPSDLATLSRDGKRALHEHVAKQVFEWNRWREVLAAAFDLEPLPLGMLSLQQLATMMGTSKTQGPEGEHHRRLKEYVAACPSEAGVGAGLPMGRTENLLLSGDRLDVFFDGPGQWVCAEVKGSDSSDGDILRGIFQCVKYRAVLEAQRHYLRGAKLPSVRVMLILGRDLPRQLKPILDRLAVDVIPGVVVPDGFDKSMARRTLLATPASRGIAGASATEPRFEEMKGIAKGLFESLGGGENFLRCERASFEPEESA